MSFFGFDTTLPRDSARGANRGQSSTDDPFNPMGGELDDGRELEDEELDAKIKGLTAGAQEDVEIYEWGGEGYDGLGDMLDEAGDDLNDDTFGGASVGVGKDFDFGHGSTQSQNQNVSTKPTDSMFASTFDDFWAVPSFGTAQRQKAQQDPMPPVPSLPKEVQHEQQPLASPAPAAGPPPPQAKVGLTMEEIEAELRASKLSQQQQQSLPTPIQSYGNIAIPPQPHQHTQPHGGPPVLPIQQDTFPAGTGHIKDPQFAARIQGQHGQAPFRGPHGPQHQLPPPPNAPAGPRRDPLGPDFPPLGAPPPPGADSSPPPPAPREIPLHRPQEPDFPPPPPPPPSAEFLKEQQAQHFARMHALLRALPEIIQQRIIALPQQMHFDVLTGVSREFPVLLEPRTAVVADLQEQAQIAALRRLDKLGEVREKIARREAKIAAMSRYNNVMTVSDKEFITRIQISQIITADPYADDFYAHIFFALRNNRSLVNPGLMGAPPGSAGPGSAPNQPPQQPPKGPKSKGVSRMNAQQKAMLRMQQQVERLVADRKQRIEKASSGTVNPNLQGALGKVGGNTANNPRKALQISNTGDDVKVANGNSAADAVRQALEGASLGGKGEAAASADGKRPPLTRHESLRILETLYDIVLNLEQLRRSVDNANDEAAQATAREQQTALVETLWKELRILEPLAISDPHPFVSLLGTIKGKRLVPRILRHLTSEQTLTVLTMIVASFDTLDVVRDAALLDDVSSFIPGVAPTPSPSTLAKRREVEEQSETFGTTVVPAMLGLMNVSPMKIVIGMLAIFVERNDVVRIVRSRAGIAFLTILLSRAATLRSQPAAPASTDGGAATGATPEELAQWSSIFQLLFERLVTGSGGLSNLFPSSRAKSNLPFGLSSYLLQQSSNPLASNLQSHLDEADEPIWHLYAALAINATSSNSMEQQSILVQELREKILENVLEARSKRDSLDGERKLRLVNIFLNALNLDASQITF